MPVLDFDYRYEQKDRQWPNTGASARLGKLFDDHRPQFLRALKELSDLEKHFLSIPLEQDSTNSLKPFWNNPWFPAFDAIALAGSVALRKPKIFMEIGSGNSTMFVRHIIKKLNLSTKIVSIDPHPRADIDDICDEVARSPLEDTDFSIFQRLTPGDILFVDNSHRSFPSSDVTVFFMEVLPSLPKGVLCGLHDIFLPFDYPMKWSDRFYNEQYLLGAYLFGRAYDRVRYINVKYLRRLHKMASSFVGNSNRTGMYISTQYLCRHHGAECKAAFPKLSASGVSIGGGSLFFEV